MIALSDDDKSELEPAAVVHLNGEMWMNIAFHDRMMDETDGEFTGFTATFDDQPYASWFESLVAVSDLLDQLDAIEESFHNGDNAVGGALVSKSELVTKVLDELRDDLTNLQNTSIEER